MRLYTGRPDTAEREIERRTKRVSFLNANILRYKEKMMNKRALIGLDGRWLRGMRG